MSTFLVRKNGSGTHTTIQSAIYDASAGDTVSVEAGTFYENLEITKNIILEGAGKDQTIIRGKLANDTITGGTWFAGDSVITVDSNAVAQRGKSITGTNITSGSRITEVIGSNQLRLSLPTVTTGNFTKTVAAYQTVAFSVAPTSGTFKLNYKGVDTAAINWNDTASTIQTKLRAISGLATVVVTGTISGKLLTVAFDGVTTPVAALTVSANALAPSVGVTVTLIEALVSGSSTIVLPNTTSVAVGQKVEGTGVNATITALNTTTRTITLSSPITQTGSGILLSFRLARSNVSITQVTNPSSSSGPASIMISGITDGVQIKNLAAVGFDGTVGQEASALFFTAGTAPGHTNFLIDNCRFTADGDSAVMCGANPHLSNGVFQNCLIDGKTFTGSEPADVPSFSTYTSSAVVKSVGASSSVITFSDMRGIIIGRTCTSTAFTGSASVTAISGNDVTINKVVTASVDSTIACTFTLTAYAIPNCARNLFYVGQNTTPCNTQNITFKNNVVKGQTGALISSSGSKSMFNSAVTIESVGGLIENNVIDGIVGAGDPNPLAANWAIRSRQAGGMIVRNNTNLISGGRANSGFLVLTDFGLNLGTNTSVSEDLVSNNQTNSGDPVKVKMSKALVKQFSKVQANPIFSDESNWKLVSYIFKKTTSGQRISVSFRDFAAEKAYSLKPGMVSGDQFQLIKIIVSNPGRDLLVIKRSEIASPSNYDFTLK